MRTDMTIEHRSWDGTEPATLEAAAHGGPSQVTVPIAKRRAVRTAEKSPSGGVYLGSEVRWLIPMRELPEGVTPAPADVVIDGEGVRWTVLTRERNRGRETYALGCVDLTLAHGLRDTVVVERCDRELSAAGVPDRRFPPQGGRTLYTLQARVQELSRDLAESRGVRWAAGKFEVTVDRQLADIDVAEDRVRWADGLTVRHLDITAYRRGSRIDELPVLECVLR